MKTFSPFKRAEAKFLPFYLQLACFPKKVFSPKAFRYQHIWTLAYRLTLWQMCPQRYPQLWCVLGNMEAKCLFSLKVANTGNPGIWTMSINHEKRSTRRSKKDIKLSFMEWPLCKAQWGKNLSLYRGSAFPPVTSAARGLADEEPE